MSQNRLLRTLILPHVTEKTDKAAVQGQYVFKVEKSATKEDIKNAVEKNFSVKVSHVRVVNVKEKKIEKFGRLKGWRKGWKKAYVALQAGQNIEFLKAE